MNIEKPDKTLHLQGCTGALVAVGGGRGPYALPPPLVHMSMSFDFLARNATVVYQQFHNMQY